MSEGLGTLVLLFVVSLIIFVVVGDFLARRRNRRLMKQSFINEAWGRADGLAFRCSSMVNDDIWNLGAEKPWQQVEMDKWYRYRDMVDAGWPQVAARRWVYGEDKRMTQDEINQLPF